MLSSISGHVRTLKQLKSKVITKSKSKICKVLHVHVLFSVGRTFLYLFDVPQCFFPSDSSLISFAPPYMTSLSYSETNFTTPKRKKPKNGELAKMENLLKWLLFI